VLCVLFAASTAVLGYVVATRGPAPAALPGGENPAADPSPAGSPSLPAGEIALHSRGYVIPSHQILVSPQVTGRIATLRFREGDRIDKEKDDVLAVLETTDYDADLRRARFALEAAQYKRDELQRTLPEETIQVGKELEEAKAQLDPLQKAYERNRKLKEANPAFVADQDLDESESRFLAAKRRVERLTSVLKLMTDGTRQKRILAAEADVRQAEAELAKAQWRLDNCTIRAPISGTILKKNAEVGNIVNPIAFNGSYSLCDMADLCDLEVEVDVQERELARVFTGQRCTVYAEAYPERKYDGVARLMPIANRSKGALPVRVKVLNIPRDEEGRYLKPDMGAMVIFWNPKSAAERK
jgi:multidrug resistance efflux pump